MDQRIWAGPLRAKIDCRGSNVSAKARGTESATSTRVTPSKKTKTNHSSIDTRSWQIQSGRSTHQWISIPKIFQKTLPDEPFTLAISDLPRTPEADIKRASWIRRNLPRQEALTKIKAILKDRPDDPTLVTMTAELLLSLAVPRRTKMELDCISDQEPKMPGYWSIDSAVLHALSKSSDNPAPLLENAIASGVKPIKINPEFDGGHIGLAIACEGLQLFDRAAQSWSRASQLAANDQRSEQLNVNALRGRSLAGETDEAAEKLLSLLKNQNEPTDTLLLESA